MRAGVCVASIVKMRGCVGVDAVGDGVELAGRRSGRRRGRRARPSRSAAVAAGGGDRRIGRRGAFGALVDHDVRAGEAVLDEVGLVGGDEQVARRDGDSALRADAGRQQLEKLGAPRRCPVDADQRGALGSTKR